MLVLTCRGKLLLGSPAWSSRRSFGPVRCCILSARECAYLLALSESFYSRHNSLNYFTIWLSFQQTPFIHCDSHDSNRKPYKWTERDVRGHFTLNPSNLFYAGTLLIAILLVDIYYKQKQIQYNSAFHFNYEWQILEGNLWFKEVCHKDIFKIVRVIDKWFHVLIFFLGGLSGFLCFFLFNYNCLHFSPFSHIKFFPKCFIFLCSLEMFRR